MAVKLAWLLSIIGTQGGLIMKEEDRLAQYQHLVRSWHIIFSNSFLEEDSMGLLYDLALYLHSAILLI